MLVEYLANCPKIRVIPAMTAIKTRKNVELRCLCDKKSNAIEIDEIGKAIE